ncbi:caspase family protein [Candidatus Bipolaricaulota bacterium]
MNHGFRTGRVCGLALLLALASWSLVGFAESVDGYAVLMEVDDHPEGYSDIPIEYVHVTWLTEMLTNLGWSEERILVRTDAEVTEWAVIEAIEWLAERADQDDLVVFLIAAHGTFIRVELGWNEIFPALWASVPTSRKLLLVDACHAGEYTSTAVYGPMVMPEDTVLGTGAPGIAISSVAYDEYGWVGIPEEGDPIIGSSFLYYLAPAFGDEAADANGDGFTSVEEAFAAAVPPTQVYHRDVVFGNHPENVAAFESLHVRFDPEDFPHPHLIDEYPGELILDLSWYRDP